MTSPLAAETSGRALGRRLGFGPGQLLVVAATAAIGFLLVGQLQSSSRTRQPLAAESEDDLARILASLNTEADALREEIADLRLQLLSLQTSTQQDAAAEAAAQARLQALQVLAGTVPVTGPGVEVVIDDPRRAVTYDVLLDTVQELRDAGAEAVAVNDVRIGAQSAFGEGTTPQGPRVLLDGTVLTPPYRLTAIGQSATLEGGLEIPGGSIDTLQAIAGVEVAVQRLARVDIPALAEPPSFRAARPVGSGP